MYRLILLVVCAIAFTISGWSPNDRRDWWLEQIPSFGLIVLLAYYERRRGGRPLSDTAYTCVAVFLLLHAVGSHYLYSFVPYDAWSESLFGVSPASEFGWRRNHFDRLVHFGFGALGMLPMLELVRRHVTAHRGWSLVVAIAFLAVMSKLYELVEWGIALTMSPANAEAYNGQQGDMFDAHKDMGLAFLASILVAPWAARRSARAAEAAPSARFSSP